MEAPPSSDPGPPTGSIPSPASRTPPHAGSQRFTLPMMRAGRQVPGFDVRRERIHPLQTIAWEALRPPVQQGLRRTASHDVQFAWELAGFTCTCRKRFLATMLQFIMFYFLRGKSFAVHSYHKKRRSGLHFGSLFGTEKDRGINHLSGSSRGVAVALIPFLPYRCIGAVWLCLGGSLGTSII